MQLLTIADAIDVSASLAECGLSVDKSLPRFLKAFNGPSPTRLMLHTSIPSIAIPAISFVTYSDLKVTLWVLAGNVATWSNGPLKHFKPIPACCILPFLMTRTHWSAPPATHSVLRYALMNFKAKTIAKTVTIGTTRCQIVLSTSGNHSIASVIFVVNVSFRFKYILNQKERIALNS